MKDKADIYEPTTAIKNLAKGVMEGQVPRGGLHAAKQRLEGAFEGLRELDEEDLRTVGEAIERIDRQSEDEDEETESTNQMKRIGDGVHHSKVRAYGNPTSETKAVKVRRDHKVT